MAFSEVEFRHCMGNFATGVVVVTTSSADGANHGVTISSFASLSLNPPLIMFGLDKQAHIHHHFIESQKFIVNILSENQQDISQNFAHPSSVDWLSIEYDESEITKSPILKGANAFIECDLHKTLDGGDHTIMVGKVVNLKTLSDNPPLVYYKGQYNNLNGK